ncbi:MAG: DUF1573 domain-containing protein [Gemmataceae bacterium]
MSVDRERIDLGTVKAGPTLEAKFKIQHTGTSGTLIITGVETSCGCLQTTATKLTMTAGESTEIGVAINSLTQAAGENSWRFVVHVKREVPGNDKPTTGSQTLLVTANLVREILVKPPMMAISTTGETSQTITVTDQRPNGSMTITNVASTSPHLKATIQPDKTIQVTLDAAAPADGKTHSEFVTISTNDPAYPQFRIPVSVVKRSPAALSLTPDRFTLRFATGETSKSGIVQLRDPAGKAITIASATCSHPGVSLSFSPGAHAITTVKATVDSSKAQAKGTADVIVTLSTGHALTVPLEWNGTD